MFPRPAYQEGVPGIGANRAVPDVAASADLDSGLAGLVRSGSSEVVGPMGGTSAGAPFWAGIMAIADQYAGRDLGFVNPAIYEIAKSPQYHSAFNDVTKGTNSVRSLATHRLTGYSAGPGWDRATGWGTPGASVLVPLLAGGTKTGKA